MSGHPDPDAREITVLLVEDSPTQARRTRLDLERHAFHVIAASNGREALNDATTWSPDVILSDVLMPEMDGFRLCLEARMDPRLRSIPIILRSAQFIATEDQGLARAAGADAYIPKDLSASELAAVVRKTIEDAGEERVFFDPETFRSEYGARLLAKVVQDVAELEAVNEQLVENQAMLRGVLENASAAIYVRDVDGRFVLANPQFRKLVGQNGKNIIGATPHELLPAESADLLETNDRRVLTTLSAMDFEEEVLSGGDRHFLASAKFPLFDASGRAHGVCAISSDVTERKRLEQELRELQKMETVGLLAGGVAHDFGNYLSAISTFAFFIEETLEPDDPRSEDLSEIKKAAQHATALARQLMTLSRQDGVAPEVIDLNAVISDMEQLLSVALGSGFRLEMDLESDLSPILINPGHLEQILMNLAVNARDAMPSGGSVVIATSGLDITASENGGHTEDLRTCVRLRVSDTGEGMTSETKERLFDPFFTTKSRKKGTGLGLATVKKVVDQAGGAISVDSTPGRGTTFEIVFPSPGARVAATEDQSERLGIRGGGENILVIDDDPDVQACLERILIDSGFTALVAATSKEAIEIFHRNEEDIDLVITDVFLPGTSGRDLAKTLKQRQPDIGLIFISALFEAAFPEGTVDYDATFVPKPIKSDELLSATRTILQANRTSRRT